MTIDLITFNQVKLSEEAVVDEISDLAEDVATVDTVVDGIATSVSSVSGNLTTYYNNLTTLDNKNHLIGQKPGYETSEFSDSGLPSSLSNNTVCDITPSAGRIGYFEIKSLRPRGTDTNLNEMVFGGIEVNIDSQGWTLLSNTATHHASTAWRNMPLNDPYVRQNPGIAIRFASNLKVRVTALPSGTYQSVQGTETYPGTSQSVSMGNTIKYRMQYIVYYQ